MDGKTWEAPDKSFTKTVLIRGQGLSTPNEGSVCDVRIETSGNAVLNWNKLLGYDINNKTRIVLGDGIGTLSSIVDATLETMQTGEICCIKINPKILERKLSEESKDHKSKVQFQVQLIEFERSRDIHLMTLKDKVARIARYKFLGGECFKAGNLDLAEGCYIRAIKYATFIAFDSIEGQENEGKQNERFIEADEFKSLYNLCLLNIAACHLKRERYEDVKHHCTKAIEMNRNNPKGYFRRGQAHMAFNDYELAMEDFKVGLKLEPHNKSLQEQLKLSQEKIKETEQSYAKSMKKLFD